MSTRSPGLHLRWLDWIFLGGYLPSLSINYVAVSKDMGRRLPQLYYIKMKISYDLGFIAIGVTMATYLLAIDLGIVKFILKFIERFLEKCENCRHRQNYVQKL